MARREAAGSLRSPVASYLMRHGLTPGALGERHGLCASLRNDTYATRIVSPTSFERMVILFIMASLIAYCGMLLWADTTGGSKRLWLAWLGTALPLAFGGYLSWYIPYARTGYTETAGILPIVLALLPTFVAAVTIRASARTRWAPPRRWLLATVAAVVSVYPTAFLGHYLLPEFLPAALGCCPL